MPKAGKDKLVILNWNIKKKLKKIASKMVDTRVNDSSKSVMKFHKEKKEKNSEKIFKASVK